MPLHFRALDMHNILEEPMQKGNRDGMCYCYALNITKYSTTVVSCLHSFKKTNL